MSDDLVLFLPDDETPAPADTPSGEALALAARGEWARAERLFDAARTSAARGGDDVALAVALTNRGQALARLGRLEEAASTLDAALGARRRLHAAGAASEAVVARGIADVAAVTAALGDVTEAARLLRRARAHAVAGGAEDVVLAIDERLAAARALGAADAEDEEVTLPLPAGIAVPGSGADWSGERAEPLTTAGAGVVDAPLDLDMPVALDTPLALEPAMPLEEPLSFGATEPLAEPVALDGSASWGELVTFEPAALAPADDVAGAEPLPIAGYEDEGPSEGPALTFLDAEPAGEDAWSLADPAPSDQIDAAAVHSRAATIDSSRADHGSALALEPTAFGSADPFPALRDEEPSDGPPDHPLVEALVGHAAAGEPAHGAELAADATIPPAPRRRTTRDVPPITPPEPKRPWWRRLGSRR